MDKIVFRNGKAIAISIPTHKDEEEQEHEIESIVPYLTCPVTIESATFANIWRYLEHDAEIMGLVFSDAMGHFSIKPYIDQSHRPSDGDGEAEDNNNRIEYLVCGWGGTICEGKLDIYTDFGGFGPITIQDTDGKITEETYQGSWGIEFTTINKLMHYPLKLNEKIEIYEEHYGGPAAYREDLTWSGTKEWTVYDMYYAILYEITFCGLPNDQVLKVAELDQSLAEARDWINKRA